MKDWCPKNEVNRRWVFETGLVVGLKEKSVKKKEWVSWGNVRSVNVY